MRPIDNTVFIKITATCPQVNKKKKERKKEKKRDGLICQTTESSTPVASRMMHLQEHLAALYTVTRSQSGKIGLVDH